MRIPHRDWPPYFADPMGKPVTTLQDAESLEEAAAHVEAGGLAGAASLMRRCALRLRKASFDEGNRV